MAAAVEGRRILRIYAWGEVKNSFHTDFRVADSRSGFVNTALEGPFAVFPAFRGTYIRPRTPLAEAHHRRSLGRVVTSFHLFGGASRSVVGPEAGLKLQPTFALPPKTWYGCRKAPFMRVCRIHTHSWFRCAPLCSTRLEGSHSGGTWREGWLSAEV